MCILFINFPIVKAEKDLMLIIEINIDSTLYKADVNLNPSSTSQDKLDFITGIIKSKRIKIVVIRVVNIIKFNVLFLLTGELLSLIIIINLSINSDIKLKIF